MASINGTVLGGALSVTNLRSGSRQVEELRPSSILRVHADAGRLTILVLEDGGRLLQFQLSEGGPLEPHGSRQFPFAREVEMTREG